jgi:hypothetical protein
VAVAGEGYGGVTSWAEGTPGGSSLEEEVNSCSCSGRRTPGRTIDEAICSEFDAVLEAKGGRDEETKAFTNLRERSERMIKRKSNSEDIYSGTTQDGEMIQMNEDL